MRRNLRDNCDEKFRGGETETHSQDFPPRTSMGCSARFAYTLKRRLDRGANRSDEVCDLNSDIELITSLKEDALEMKNVHGFVTMAAQLPLETTQSEGRVH